MMIIKKLTAEQKSALSQVYFQISGDIPDDYDSLEIAELIIDAGRLTMMGYPEVDKQMANLVWLDYDKTLELIAFELDL